MEKKPQMDVEKIVEACIKEMQAQQPKQEQSERRGLAGNLGADAVGRKDTL